MTSSNGWFIDAGKTRTITVTNPDTADTAEVELRQLDAGAQAEIQDTLVVRLAQEAGQGEDVDVDVQAKMGTLKLITVEKAIVRWTLPVDVTPAVIRQLHPKVLEQIFTAIGEPEKKQDPTPAVAVAAAS
jgi:hypothetical protein